jgi:hypothetical protein
MKFTLSFADFSAAVAAAGYTPLAQTEKVYVVKPKAKGAGKVEINLSSGTFYVGAGSRHVEALGTAVADYYKPIKQTKGWTVFMVPLAADTGAAEIMADFMKIVQLVEQATPKATGKAPKAPKAKATVAGLVSKALSAPAKPKSAEQIMRAAEVKAKNLATMKAVTAKINAEKAA